MTRSPHQGGPCRRLQTPARQHGQKQTLPPDLMTTLDELGPRICILGPSNSGKSTLAEAIAGKRDLPAIHLDQLFHTPHTDWIPRPAQEFVHLHDAAIAQEQWVMEATTAERCRSAWPVQPGSSCWIPRRPPACGAICVVHGSSKTGQVHSLGDAIR